MFSTHPTKHQLQLDPGSDAHGSWTTMRGASELSLGRAEKESFMLHENISRPAEASTEGGEPEAHGT